MITVQHLSRRFGPVLALDDLSFHLERGEVVGFLGPNGAGKTTTMRILSGYLPATTGSVEIAGLDVLRQSLAVRKRIGYLPEAVPLYREHRVTEMLTFQARLHGMGKTARKRKIPEVLERVGILDRSDSLIGRLSRGQRQRVGLAVALLPDPEVLILDEPTSGLDPLQRLEMRRLLSALARAHTVLLSSHILPEVEAVCPRVIILNRGRIAADGTPEGLVEKLGGSSHVRLEAVVGADAAGAARLLGSIRGVREVRDEGRLGIHERFTLVCDEDLREDVGALAAQRGWALRELSWQRPTLEQLFTRIALDLGADDAGDAGDPEDAGDAGRPGGGVPAASAREAPVALELTGRGSASTRSLPTLESGTRAPESAPKVLYNLNPFDSGASRDLSQPKPVDPPAPPGERARREGPGG